MLFASLLLLQTAVVPASSQAVPEKKICRVTEAPTGSIMPPKRVCKFKREWAEIDVVNQRQMDTYNNSRSREGRPIN